MLEQIYTLTDGAHTNILIEFISTYFPFIDMPLKLTYRRRTYNVITTQRDNIEFEDFFITHNCFKCSINCCKSMYIPIGFELYWPEERLNAIRQFKPRRYTVLFNNQKMNYYIGFVGNRCKFQNRKYCTIWDSNNEIQRRPMGCYFFPITWYWNNKTIIFTKYCDPYLCKAESTKYTKEDLNQDINTFEKLCKEIKMIGLPVNYAPINALKEQSYFSI